MSDDILRGLIENERAALQPAENAKTKTWSRVARSVAIAAPMPVAATPALASKAAAWWTKGIVALAVGGAVAVGVGVLGQSSEQQIEPQAEQRVGPQVEMEPGAVAAGPGGEAHVPAPPSEADRVDAPAVVRDMPPVAETRESPRPAAEVFPVARDSGSRGKASAADATLRELASSGLAEEARLVIEARRKLQGATPAAALSPLAEHARRFPDGQLTEERMALTARALCSGGDLEGGRRVAEDLRRAFPTSSHLPRVGRACDEPTSR